jgi:alpha-beta hydrolase superfamily lysophospholipase
MGFLFQNDLHDEFALMPMACIPYGGATMGELRTIAASVGGGDDTAFYNAWVAAGDRLSHDADALLESGFRISARTLYLRAACYYSAAYHPLYGAPTDPRLVAAYREQIAVFDKAAALSNPTVLPVRIPFEATTLPGYWVPAAESGAESRPLVIFTNGYDATLTDLYFASATAAARRGYHSIVFDGPGQGEMLYEQGMPMRPDWETVVAAVLQFASAMKGVDPDRIALNGWSLGGYLALRAASGNPRLAACIADPGLASVAGGARMIASKMGASASEVADLGKLDQSLIDHMSLAVTSNASMRWKIIQRGFWVNGVSDLRTYLASIQEYTMDGRLALIRCPTLLTTAEEDPLGASTAAVFEKLQCPKTLLSFKSEEGAGDHCELMNRPLLNDRTLDWLDTTFKR